MIKGLNALHRLHSQVTPWNFELLEEPIDIDSLSKESFYEDIISEVIQRGEQLKDRQRKEEQLSSQER